MTALEQLKEKELNLSELWTIWKDYIAQNFGRIISNGILLSLPAVAAYFVFIIVVAIALASTIMTIYANYTNTIANTGAFGIEVIVALVIAAIVFMIIGVWNSAALQTWIYRDISGLNPGFKDSASIAFKKTPKVFLTQLLTSIIMGLLSLIVPVIIVIITFARGVTAPTFAGSGSVPLENNFSQFLGVAAMIILPLLIFVIIGVVINTFLGYASSLAVIRDSISPFAAMKRSIAIVKGRFWRVFGKILAGGATLFAADLSLRSIGSVTYSIHDGLGLLFGIVYVIAYATLGYFVFIYWFFLFINLDSSKPENHTPVI